MANINQVAQHHTTQTNAVIWARSITNGVMSVAVNGQTFTGETFNTSVDDGCAITNITGLSAGQDYPYTVYSDSTVVGAGTLKTMPATGSTFSLGFTTCTWYVRSPLPLLALAQVCPDLRGMCWLGDQVYTSEPSSGGTVTTFGETLQAVERLSPNDEALSMAQIYRFYRAFWQQHGTSSILKSMPNWFVGDDHDHNVGNNWDGTIAAVNGFFSWATTQAQADNMHQWHLNAMRAYTKGNPDWPLTYFKTRINDDVEVFFVDAVNYRDISDGTGTTALGATQLQWLKDGLQNSTSTFKLIMCNKNFLGTADDFSKYAAEKANLQAFLTNMTGWAVPGGVFWGSGDIHYPYASYDASIPLVNVCSSPSATGATGTVGNGYIQANRIWKATGNFSNSLAEERYFKAAAFVRVHGSERLEFGVVDIEGGVRWCGNIYAGSNELVYDDKRVG